MAGLRLRENPQRRTSAAERFAPTASGAGKRSSLATRVRGLARPLRCPASREVEEEQQLFTTKRRRRTMRLNPLQSGARLRKTALGAALALGMLAGPSVAHAQSAIIYGSVGNFDISNDTGKICHGFEIDLDGQTTVLPSSASFTANRYGAPNSFLYTGGVAVRWESPLHPQHAVLRRAHAAAHGPVVPGSVLPVESCDLPGLGLRALRYRPGRGRQHHEHDGALAVRGSGQPRHARAG